MRMSMGIHQPYRIVRRYWDLLYSLIGGQQMDACDFIINTHLHDPFRGGIVIHSCVCYRGVGRCQWWWRRGKEPIILVGYQVSTTATWLGVVIGIRERHGSTHIRLAFVFVDTAVGMEYVLPVDTSISRTGLVRESINCELRTLSHLPRSTKSEALAHQFLKLTPVVVMSIF